MSEIAELHLLKARIAELEETVEIIDTNRRRNPDGLRDKLACAFAAKGAPPDLLYALADEALKCREMK